MEEESFFFVEMVGELVVWDRFLMCVSSLYWWGLDDDGRTCVRDLFVLFYLSRCLIIPGEQYKRVHFRFDSFIKKLVAIRYNGFFF